MYNDATHDMDLLECINELRTIANDSASNLYVIDESGIDQLNEPTQKNCMTESSHNINVPMDLKALDEALQARAPRILYHGSNTLITGELLPMNSGTTGVHLFATDSYAFALAFSGKQWNDLELNQSLVDGVMYLTEILPGKLQEKYGDGGFVYELPGAGFTRFQDSKHEFITDIPVKPIKVHRVFKTIDEMRNAGVRIYEYPDLPPFIKSRKDYIMGKCKTHGIRIPKDALAQLRAENARNRTVRLAEAAIPILNDIIAESAGAKSVIDPNHKQKGTMKLSDLKPVKVDKEYLQKHGKKGALRDASASNEYCATVAWELDGVPVVTIAVGYPNPKEREPGDNYNWIGNLLVDPKYRGYGLGKQAMEYAIKELGGDALAVRSNNEIAISMYKKRGFKTSKDSARAVANKHANYYQMYLHEDIGIDVSMNEASTQWFSKPNLELNLDRFKSGEDNLLLVTGISGGGKSTLAEKLAEQYGAEIINMDIVQRFYISGPDVVANWSEERFKRGKVKVHPFDLEYYRENPDIPWGKIPKVEGWCKPDYLYWLIDRCHREPNRRFIVDGAVITYADPEYLRGIPLIIVGTGALKAHWRRSVRLTKNRSSFAEWIKAVAKGMDKMTHINNMKKAAQSTSDFRAQMEGEPVNEAIAETDSIDRQEKERIANQYELRDVGNSHMQEDRIYADIEEYKRQNALKKKQRAKEQEHDRRMRYLKKANRVRKRKRILRKIKRAILPGVKNEDVGSVDNTDTESRELADIRQEETFGGNRKRYFESKVQYANASEADNGPTIIESSVKIQFRKPVLESAGGDGSTEVIDVVFFSVDGVVQQIGILGKSDTRILTVQRTGSGDSSRISLVVGTDINPKLYSRGKPSYDLFIVFGKDGFNILSEVKRRFDAYASKHAVFSLDGSADAMTNAEFCELLIRYLSGIEPNDTLDVQLAHHSNTLEIDKVAVSKKVDLLIAEKNLQQKLQEGANIDLHPDNPWQDLILEYQLGFDGDYNS